MRTKELVIILILGMLVGCSGKRQYFPNDIEGVEVEIVRFDTALLAVRTDADILRLYEEFPDFMIFYSEDILGIDANDTSFMLEALPAYLGDTIYHFAQVNEKVKETFNDISDLRSGLGGAFGRLQYLYPEIEIPQITLFVSGFNASLLFWEPLTQNQRYDILPLQNQYIAVGLDMYLGSDYEYYNRVVWNYQKQTMRKECISVDVVSAYLFRTIPFSSDKSRLLENMIYRGKIMYLLSELFPDEEDYEIMGYTKAQWQWAEKNESGIWQMIVDKRDLWKSENPLLTSYLNDGPFTAEISQEAPARLGTYIGWKIAESYMENNLDVSLQELMAEPDAQKVLELSKYKP